MPSPVTRIAPKPSRLTVKSPPKLNVGFVAIFDDVPVSAPRITSDLPARSAAPLAKLIPRNLRRVTLAFSFRSEVAVMHAAQRTFMQIAVNASDESTMSLASTARVFERFRSHSAFVSRMRRSCASHLEQRMISLRLRVPSNGFDVVGRDREASPTIPSRDNE